MSEVERVRAFLRLVGERVSARSEPFEHGIAQLVPELPQVYWLNRLVVEDAAGVDAATLAAAADRIQGGARLLHRRVVIDDPRGAELADGFRALGWSAERHAILVHRGAAPPAGGAREVPFAEVEPVLRAENREAGLDEETVRQLVAARARLAAVDVRFFVADADGRAASHCELYSDGATAQIEDVGTLAAFRGRGLATRVVGAALGAAAAAGSRLVFLLADAGDWPLRWYERLGFEAVGERWELTRTLEALRAIRLRTPRLELRIPTEDELRALGELARGGIHPPERMPFYVPWTDRAGAPGFVDDTVAHHLERLASWSVDDWGATFGAFLDGEPVGIQALRGERFRERRVVDSGSWLGAGFQDRGLGTEMRAAVLELAFRGLGARAATSGAMVDNPQSQRVSAKLGYEQVGETVQRPRGKPVVELLYRLERDRWRSPVPVELVAVEPALPLFGAV